jgi:hypothetical protein
MGPAAKAMVGSFFIATGRRPFPMHLIRKKLRTTHHGGRAYEHWAISHGKKAGPGGGICRSHWHEGRLRGALNAKGKGADMKAGTDRSLADMRELAVQIADRFARSEIEMFCRNVAAGKGRPVFDISCPLLDPGTRQDQWLAAVADAVHYIELRRDALPYRMHHVHDLVWFEDLA